MTNTYTIKADTSASVDLTVTLEIEAESEDEAKEMFERQAREEIERLPWGSAEINSAYIDHVAADLIEVVEVEPIEEEEYEEDEDDE
jgi:hypothetical protein